MSNDELLQQINQLKEKLAKTEIDFENYKKSTKQLEEFMEEESTKKQVEIRKCKEELILKQKNYKKIKQELTVLQGDYTLLKGELAQANETNMTIEQSREDLKRLECLVVNLQVKNSQLLGNLEEKEKFIIRLRDDAKCQQDTLQNKVQELHQLVQQLNAKMLQLEDQKDQLLKRNNSQKSNLEILVSRNSGPQPQGLKKDSQINKTNFEKEKIRYQEKIRKLEEALAKADKQVKQSKAKLLSLTQQNQILRNRTMNMSIRSGDSPSPMVVKSVEEQSNGKYNYYCLLLTKPYYISPFLEIYENRSTIKIYKSSRTGCFQKSMGCYRHKFQKISFQQESLLEPIAKKIKNVYQTNHHSVIFYGVKKSSKKYLMSTLMIKIKDFLIQKMESSSQIEAVFIKRSQQEHKNFRMSGEDQQSAIEVIDKVIGLGFKSEKPKQKPTTKKIQSKPKVRYFSIKIDDFLLQVGTTSHTNIFFRQSVNVPTMFNNIFYSKLPNILQSTISQKHLVLTLNPIIDLYEDCKNTLSATLCKSLQQEYKDDAEPSENWKGSPVRQELNELAKRKIDNYERQTEQTSIKIRRLEVQCLYYKSRFDQLQFRLKNLLNTHSAQNTYLKKSPVTLSYQKLLKFVHSVQIRNSLANNANQSNSNLGKSPISDQKEQDGEIF